MIGYFFPTLICSIKPTDIIARKVESRNAFLFCLCHKAYFHYLVMHKTNEKMRNNKKKNTYKYFSKSDALEEARSGEVCAWLFTVLIHLRAS